MTISKQPSFTGYVKSRIRDNKNFIGMFVGPTGSGKSYGCLRLAENLDSDFNINRVSFTPKAAMEVINSGTLKKGSVVIWEEAGVSASARNWQSLSNKMLLFVTQTFRNLNLVVLLNAPDLSFLDVGIRKLIHGSFETVTIDRKTKEVVVKPKLFQVNQMTGKIYPKYLRICTAEGVVPYTRLRLGMPSKQLTEDYEAVKTTYTQALNRDILNELQKQEADRAKKLSKLNLTDQQRTVLELLNSGKLIPEVAKEMGIKDRSVYKHMELSENKGIKICAIKKEKRLIRYEIEGL